MTLGTVYGIVVRDLTRSSRQKGRVIGGLARSFMWLLLVGSGYNAIVRVDGVPSYREFIFPGIVVMAVLFGAMLTAISTVYDREFGMLRLMLASPAGVPAILAGRALAAGLIGVVHGLPVLLVAPLITSVTATQLVITVPALVLAAMVSSLLGLLVAAPLRSVENFAGVVNVVLFPLLFLSGALYPTAQMPAWLRGAALVNPITYAVDLTRHTLGQATEFGTMRSVIVLCVAMVVAFVATAFLFDAEQRFVPRSRAGTR